MNFILSWIDKLKSSSNEKLFDQLISVLFCLLVFLSCFYFISLFEPQVFQDLYLNRLDNLGLHNLSFKQAYFHSIDPVRNFLFRLFEFNDLNQVWLFNGVIFSLIIIFLYLTLSHLYQSDNSRINILLLTLLISFNLSFLRILHGTQNISILIGIFIFLVWQVCFLYLNKIKFLISPLLIIVSISNLLLLPLSIFGLIQYYKKDQTKIKIIVYVLLFSNIVISFFFKSIFMKAPEKFLNDEVLMISSYLDTGANLFSFKKILIGLLGSIGKIVFPLGTRYYYDHLILADYIGLVLIAVFVIGPIFYLIKKEKVNFKEFAYLFSLLFISILWSVFYRMSFFGDKITSFEYASTVFYFGFNNDDLISFYLLSFMPLLLLFKKNKIIQKKFLVSGIVFQFFIFASYGPRLVKTGTMIDSQLRYEESNVYLNLSKLYYASINKDSFTQANTFINRVKVDKSKSEKIKFLGLLYHAKLLAYEDPVNLFVASIESYERNNFHNYVLLDLYLYLRDFNKLKKVIYDIENNSNISFSRKNDFRKNIDETERLYFLASLKNMGMESLQGKNIEKAVDYYLLAYQYSKNKNEIDEVLKYLNFISKNKDKIKKE